MEDFNKIWYSDKGTWHRTKWLGVRILKNPCDLMVYQELITQIRPSTIIECGTKHGGSALFMATICHGLGSGSILTIDITKPRRPPKHPRIHYYTGSSVDPKTVQVAYNFKRRFPGPTMVILDSDHHKDHVLKEIELYSPMVTKGSYLIVEDTNLNRVVPWLDDPGPAGAVDEWLPKQDRFEVDRDCERYLLTFNPGGYLKCVR